MKLMTEAAFLMFSAKSCQLVVGLEVGEAGVVVELLAGLVERRNARLTAARQVEHRQVERQAQQIGCARW